MNKISRLKSILAKNFDWNKARIDCFARIILSLFAVRTVNLKEIALCFESKSKIDSRYRRLQRFFSEFIFNAGELSRWLFGWFFQTKQKVYLIVDRTNWYWGKQKINILMLSVAYEGLTIPLFWQLLNKAGNASGKEHCEIIERYLNYFDKSNILGVLGDREFANGELFHFLNQANIPFYIRIKEGSVIKVGAKKLFCAEKIFRHLNPKAGDIFASTVFIYGQKVYLAGSRSERGELMIVATNQLPKKAIFIYLRRWEIENLFQSLKQRGFYFENTHMVKSERLSTLIGVLAVAFCWAHKIGEWRSMAKPIIFKKFRYQTRPQYTLFRYGLDYMREVLLNPLSTFKPNFTKLLQLFPPPHFAEIL